MKWRDAKKESPPKDGVFLADVGYPWAVICVYNPAMDEYSYAELETSIYQGKNDPSFINEWTKEHGIIAWAELPKTQIKQKWQKKASSNTWNKKS